MFQNVQVPVIKMCLWLAFFFISIVSFFGVIQNKMLFLGRVKENMGPNLIEFFPVCCR